MESTTGWKSNVEISPNCPRCGSSNTKFCYYNNYSLTQPRYFCKGCRRYWTKGGSLRNVPVGGGCRKNRRGNKTLIRQSIDAAAALTFKNSPPCHAATDTIGHHNSYHHDPTSMTNVPTSSSSDGPNIDLALVYANFLNQKPAGDSRVENIPETAAFDPCLENSTEVVGLGSLHEELGLTGCLNLPVQPSNDFNSMKLQSTTLQKEDSSEQQCGNHNGATNFELPPLPGEEEASHHHQHDVLWSNSEMMINHHHLFQVNQPPPLLGPEIHDAEFLIGNWCPFDLPRDASFSEP